jgi:hypothetical protein
MMKKYNLTISDLFTEKIKNMKEDVQDFIRKYSFPESYKNRISQTDFKKMTVFGAICILVGQALKKGSVSVHDITTASSLAMAIKNLVIPMVYEGKKDHKKFIKDMKKRGDRIDHSLRNEYLDLIDEIVDDQRLDNAQQQQAMGDVYEEFIRKTKELEERKYNDEIDAEQFWKTFTYQEFDETRRFKLNAFLRMHQGILSVFRCHYAPREYYLMLLSKTEFLEKLDEAINLLEGEQQDGDLYKWFMETHRRVLAVPHKIDTSDKKYTILKLYVRNLYDKAKSIFTDRSKMINVLAVMTFAAYVVYKVRKSTVEVSDKKVKSTGLDTDGIAQKLASAKYVRYKKENGRLVKAEGKNKGKTKHGRSKWKRIGRGKSASLVPASVAWYLADLRNKWIEGEIDQEVYTRTLDDCGIDWDDFETFMDDVQDAATYGRMSYKDAFDSCYNVKDYDVQDYVYIDEIDRIEHFADDFGIFMDTYKSKAQKRRELFDPFDDGYPERKKVTHESVSKAISNVLGVVADPVLQALSETVSEEDRIIVDGIRKLAGPAAEKIISMYYEARKKKLPPAVATKLGKKSCKSCNTVLTKKSMKCLQKSCPLNGLPQNESAINAMKKIAFNVTPEAATVGVPKLNLDTKLGQNFCSVVASDDSHVVWGFRGKDPSNNNIYFITNYHGCHLADKDPSVAVLSKNGTKILLNDDNILFYSKEVDVAVYKDIPNLGVAAIKLEEKVTTSDLPVFMVGGGSMTVGSGFTLDGDQGVIYNTSEDGDCGKGYSFNPDSSVIIGMHSATRGKNNGNLFVTTPAILRVIRQGNVPRGNMPRRK